jgi:FMN phosphatase YigB (HAD superfamily)
MGLSILIDFDGVLLNNQRLNTKISDKCDRYFSNKTGLSLQQSKKINRTHYKKYGHTLNLLNEKMLKDTKVFLEDFNDYVYDDKLLGEVKWDINKNDLFNFKEWTYVLSKIKADNKYIYSNAPTVWLEECTSSLECLSNSSLGLTDIISVPEINDGLFKPTPLVYDRMDTMLSNHILFIDDSEQNLPIHRENWTNVLYAENVIYSSKSKDYTTIHSPKDMLSKMKQIHLHQKVGKQRI